MFNRFLHSLSIICVFNIFFLLAYLYPQNVISRDVASNDYISNQEKESLDVNKINSSVDAGSFYSVDTSIRQIEETMAKMAQELNRLKHHIEFAKVAEQKRILHTQKLEKENIKACQSLVNNSLDNSWTGSSSKMEFSDNKSHDVESTTTVISKKSEASQIPVITQAEASRIQNEAQSGSTQLEAVKQQTEKPQAAESNHVRQDVVVQVVGYKNN